MAKRTYRISDKTCIQLTYRHRLRAHSKREIIGLHAVHQTADFDNVKSKMTIGKLGLKRVSRWHLK